MKRAAAAIAVTVVGLWLVLTFKSSPVTRVTAPAATPATAAPTTTPPPDTTRTAPPATTQVPAGPPPDPTGTRTITGDVVSTQYGDVEVAVVLEGTRIVDVNAVELPFDRSRSAEISSQVAPLLHDEALQAQSAQIDTIGGATYTSEAYAQSLQSALSKAGG